MVNKEMYDDFMGKWKNLLKTPFSAAGNGKQKESFLKFYKEEQETFLASLTAFQDYVKSNNINGNADNVGKLWQNYLESTNTLVNNLDNCRQSQREAMFSFLKALAPQVPAMASATKQ